MASKGKLSFTRFNPAKYITDAETFDEFVKATRAMERELCVTAIERRIGQHLIDNGERDDEMKIALRSGMRLALLAIHEMK